ncbi:MAG: methyltransferase domain-containing protein, partial [Gammaproteobacteria bacterium]|nr:methyltransferase domain-containing protein [Gammaproteobacteria bacterium]
MKNPFQHKKLSAYEAIHEAHKIAFGGMIFQAVRCMRDLGILKQLEDHYDSGVSAEEIAEQLDLTLYGVETLLETGLSCNVVEMTGDLFRLSKVGYFLLNDEMTRINMDFNHDVNYLGMFHIDEAIKEGKPAGLKVFGEQWETIYPAVPHLPKKIRDSWYSFDHLYSDSAYPEALPIIFSNKVNSLVDIGTNVGKFTIQAANYNTDVQVTMIDLPDQLQSAINNVEQAGFSDRVTAKAMDMLNPQNMFPENKDVYWLSQLLSCFSEDEIVSILSRIQKVMAEDSSVYILETCWDRQQHETAAYSLVNTSLYFTAMANGNS